MSQPAGKYFAVSYFRRLVTDLQHFAAAVPSVTVERIPSERSAVRMSRVPWPLRRWLWWGALNMFGSTRCRHFGTFNITSVGSEGAGILHLVTLLTATLHHGMFDSNGGLDMRLSF